MTTNLTIILACLSMIESGDNDLAVGKRGEISRYQILPKVWKEWGFPLDAATDPTLSIMIAEKVIYFRAYEFATVNKRQPTPFEIYVLWNAPAQIGHPSKVVSEKAQRFENLVKQMEKEKK